MFISGTGKELWDQKYSMIKGNSLRVRVHHISVKCK